MYCEDWMASGCGEKVCCFDCSRKAECEANPEITPCERTRKASEECCLRTNEISD